MNCTDQKSGITLDLTDESVGTFAALVASVVAPCAWADDEDPNAPWLPKIPGPRPEQVPVPAPVRIPRQAEGEKTPSVPGQRIPAKVPQQPIRQEQEVAGETGLDTGRAALALVRTSIEGATV
ncbi:hypothetical protein [Streptomyces sp. NPDC007346]|uniref:hypothetical protein n=1 Tax=Streptomyces sp. NPDC007346 TaxID=3154682 RepID=UPI0034560F82